jgi:uncharacterized circularly permuted ATP-grasp superfamily protein/uncharacterized alpha-E superfamily protein
MADPSLALYSGSAQRYDELLAAPGKVREHWRGFVAQMSAGGVESVKRGIELARRLVLENGVTYNVYADPQGKDRPWILDPLPLLMGAEEWRRIEAGAIQRAQLLNAILADCYGTQRLVREGVVPAELVFGHPNYLAPAQGVRPRDGVWVHLHAIDMARAPDGQWWVLSDRTQTPSGLGYAFENRQIISRVFPGPITELGVRPLDGTFQALRESLMGLAESEDSLAVVLTPGPFNETYFEHAYLARRLGLPLVQGVDLTVRADTVYLKTLAGLRPVHAILRRLDDDFCDPLELRADSALGVPGLLGAVRAGRVTLANALGTGVLESPAWQGFLPGCARALLGAELQLPPVATWWCGEEPALDYVLENLERLVIKGTFPNQRHEPTFARYLSASGQQQLAERLRARPSAYVAQERVMLSHAPVWRTGQSLSLAPRALTLRVYAVWTAQGYRVLPGGLARVAAGGVSDIVSSQRGGGSKDVWVLSDGQEAPDAPPSVSTARPARAADLPSQLVENLYWVGRYSERCEDKARMLRAALGVRSERSLWRAARAACVAAGVLAEEGDESLGLYDEELEDGLAADLGRFGWAATQSRSRLSVAHWRSVLLMQREFHEAGEQKAEPVETLDRLLVSLTALAGFALDDMTQDDGWRLLMIGRRLERLQSMCTLIARLLHADAVPGSGLLGWLLEACSSSITYRTRQVASPQLAPVLQLLVYEEGNPRSLAFQWQKLRRTLADLSVALGTTTDDAFVPPVAALEEMLPHLPGLQALTEEGGELRLQFAARLQAMADAAAQVSDQLSMQHFTHVGQGRQAVAT